MRITDDIIARYKALPTGNVCDANNKSGNMDAGIKPIDRMSKLVGPAVTVRCQPGDNLVIHKAIYCAEPGSVLVIDAHGYTGAGPMGEIMVIACQERGITGVVLDGACRDANDIEELGFPFFSRGFNPGGTVKASDGEINGIIQCGGVVVNPGDLIVGDRDGVVVIARENIETVLEKAEAIAQKEIKAREMLRQGMTTLDIYGFNVKLADKKQ